MAAPVGLAFEDEFVGGQVIQDEQVDAQELVDLGVVAVVEPDALSRRSMVSVSDLATGLEQFTHPTSKLDRVATSSHAVLLQDNSIRSQSSDSTKPPVDQSLRQTQADSSAR